MALIACRECAGKVSDTAVSCPHCGAAVAGAVPAVVVVSPEIKGGSTWWVWLFIVPVGLFLVMLVIGAMNPDSPEKARDRAVYDQCKQDLEAADRGRSSASSALAGMCERFRSEYVQKYKTNP